MRVRRELSNRKSFVPCGACVACESGQIFLEIGEILRHYSVWLELAFVLGRIFSYGGGERLLRTSGSGSLVVHTTSTVQRLSKHNMDAGGRKENSTGAFPPCLTQDLNSIVPNSAAVPTTIPLPFSSPPDKAASFNHPKLAFNSRNLSQRILLVEESTIRHSSASLGAATSCLSYLKPET